MLRLALPAPAKLNLFLHVTGRRPDGYHTLETVFQLLDYGDLLEFEWRDGDGFTLSCEVPALNRDDNLITRAAALLRPYRRRQRQITVHLHKQLPLGGGVGGGSSDAGTTLLALNQLWDCGLTLPELAQLGLRLGADVPLFVMGQSAFASGVGDLLEPLSLPPRWYLVLTPDCHAQTSAIFAHPELTRDSAAIRIRAFPFSDSRNDCQPVACELYPVIRKALDWLGAYAPARMTGTGASVFAACTSKAEAEAIAAAIPLGWRGFVAQGIDQSPVQAILSGLSADTGD